MVYCEQYCKYIQIKVNEKQDEITKVDNKPGRYSTDELQQIDKLKTEFDNLTLDLQRCIDECKLRNRHRDVDDYSNDGKHVGVDPVILKQFEDLKALEEEEEEDIVGGRTRSTFRRRNKSKTKRRQTRSTRRRNTRRRRSTRRNRKQ
jgi:hypothetical protein